MKILIVDDELVSRKKMEVIMREFGDCGAVDNGYAAVREVKEALEAERNLPPAKPVNSQGSTERHSVFASGRTALIHGS